MSAGLGPIDVYCDAPPYPIVQASVLLGLDSPLDVRWCHAGDQPDQLNGDRQPWSSFFGKPRPHRPSCSCGQPQPELILYAFQFHWGGIVSYWLGQCRRCRTIYWKEE